LLSVREQKETIMVACPHCGQNHRKFPKSCESVVENLYMHVAIKHYRYSAEPGVDPSNEEEEVMLSRIRRAAPDYARIQARDGDLTTGIEHHIRHNSEVTKSYFAMHRYLDENWPGQRRGA